MKLGRTTLRVLIVLLCMTGLFFLFWPARLPSVDVLRAFILVMRSLLLLLVPGGLIMSLFPTFYEWDEKLALAPVLSLGTFPILLLFSTLGEIVLSAAIIKVLLTLGTISFAGVWFWRAKTVELRVTRSAAACAVLTGLFFLAFAVRLFQIRGLGYPAGGDSYHHTLITQLIMDGGRIPEGYAPYTPISTFTYHFGYHAFSAFLGWIAGLEGHRAVLWGGQLLNALTVPSIWFLAKRLLHSRRAAAAAAILAALVCMMPAHYVNWGRYAQLFGQVLLLPALGLLLDALANGRSNRWLMIVAGLMAAGIGLSHYRVAIFYIVGAIVVLGAVLLSVTRAQRGRVMLALLVVTGVAVLLMLPWLPTVLEKTVSSAQAVKASGVSGQYDYLTLGFVLGMGLRKATFVCALVSALWLLLRKKHRGAALGILGWILGVWFLANPGLSGTPSGFLTNGTLVLALYLPASLLIGCALADLSGVVHIRIGKLDMGLVILAMVLCFWGAVGIRDKLAWGVDRSMFWVTDADVLAMDWVEANTEPDAGFAIAMSDWQGGHIQGTDAGWWIPYVTGRRTIVPPLLYINEMKPEKMANIDALGWSLMNANGPDGFASAMDAAGLSYAYERVGKPLVDSGSLLDSERFTLAYESDVVLIYALD